MTVSVGFDGAMLRAPHTGSGQYSVALIAALRRLPDLAVSILSPVSLPMEPDAVVVAPPRSLTRERLRKVWWEQVGVTRAAHTAQAEIVHIPYFAAPLRQRVPYVITVHDVIPLLFPAYAGGRAMRAYLRLVSAGTVRAAQVIADSECSRRDAIRVLGLTPSHVTAIPLAADETFSGEEDAALHTALRERFGLHRKQVIFNVGGLDVRKNVATLLRAFARVVDAVGTEIRLVIGGSAHGNAALYPDLAPLARDLGVVDSVVFAGRLSDAEKRALYQIAACYVAPSVYEGFGLTPLEAMACGTPVVAADASCTPEVVGDAALLVASYDVEGFARAMTQVLTDAECARTLREAGIRRAAAFRWERTADATYAVYLRALTATPMAYAVSPAERVESAS